MKKYSNFRLNESKRLEILLLLSYGLRKLLKKIISSTNDRIAYDILNLHKNSSNTISYIDRSREPGMVTYTESNDVIDQIEERGLDVFNPDIYKIKSGWLENREKIRIGRLIKKILPNNTYSPNDIEQFVNRFRAESKKDTSGLIWDRVYGSRINYWYYQNNYVKGGGTLNRSCLRKQDRNKFLNFLGSNPSKVRLLILKNDVGKLLGRALLWRLPSKRIFMDRIYTRFDEDKELFIGIAMEHEFLFKSKQTFGGEIPIIDGKDGSKSWFKMELTDFDRKTNFGGYPYMDTFQYYDVKRNIISNDVRTFVKGGTVVKLNRVDGGYTSYDDVYVDLDMLD